MHFADCAALVHYLNWKFENLLFCWGWIVIIIIKEFCGAL